MHGTISKADSDRLAGWPSRPHASLGSSQIHVKNSAREPSMNRFSSLPSLAEVSARCSDPAIV